LDFSSVKPDDADDDRCNRAEPAGAVPPDLFRTAHADEEDDGQEVLVITAKTRRGRSAGRGSGSPGRPVAGILMVPLPPPPIR
jgi:hypothetical protein